jgi:hypothetical protein
MKDIAIITALFDYPEYYLPRFYRKAILEVNQEDIHIVRNSGLIQSESYYDKLYFYKVVKVLEYIKENILGKYKYILFLDATDTAFVKPLNGIIEKFNNMNCSIIFGAEKGLWPHTSYEHLYENKNVIGEYKYLNSGTYLGYTDRIVECMTNIIEKGYDGGIDDQGKWTIQYLLNNDILIDYNCNLFFSTYNSKDRVIVNGSEYSLKDVDAHIVHDNGPFNDETLKLSEYYE